MFTGFDISILASELVLSAGSALPLSMDDAQSAALHMARALAGKGARVTLFCKTTDSLADSERVRYLPTNAWSSYAKISRHDVCIVQGEFEPFLRPIDARLNLLWCHEPALGRHVEAFRGALWNVDRVIVLSSDMEEQYREVYEIDDDVFFVSPNGADLGLVAEKWLSEFEKLIRAGNRSPERLFRHLCRSSDRIAAKYHLATETGAFHLPADQRADLSKLLCEPVIDGPSVEQDPDDGAHSGPARCVLEGAIQEPDFALATLEQWLAERKEYVRAVLDYGCGTGATVIALAGRLPYLRIHGVDPDERCIGVARASANEAGISRRVTFSVCADTTTSSHGRRFDCALIREGLETAPEPWTVIEAVEREVRPDGVVYLTVPLSPRGSLSGLSTQRRLWSFDLHDLRDMLGSKPNVEIDGSHFGDDPITGERHALWIATYTADHKAVLPIDLERHLWLQRPRQTVSAAIIAGPNSEETLHWCLRSVRSVVDEIILADCGMAPEARRIASQYDVRFVEGVDPKKEGFDRARNIALDGCTSDWCLWIDTDEKLMGAEALDKYLRDNVFQTCGIRVHNFACDTSFAPQITMRLFRRRPRNGRALRFYGAIHEQPELGLNDGPGSVLVLDDVHIGHVGYMMERVRRRRFARNWPLLKLDQERYPDRILNRVFIMRENMHLVRYALERSGGRVNAEIEAKCRETIELYRKHFSGTAKYGDLDVLDYYSEALSVLGEGFEAVFQVEADKTRAQANGAQRYRFASMEDLHAALKREANKKAGRFVSRGW